MCGARLSVKTLSQVLHAHKKAVLCRLFVQRPLHNVAFMQISRIGTMPQHSFPLWFPVLAFLHIPLGDSPRSKKWAIPTLNKGQMYMVPLLTYLSWGIVVHPISTMVR
eukprot:jgi/Botrbrau1/16371/Bobra.0245s0003.1